MGDPEIEVLDDDMSDGSVVKSKHPDNDDIYLAGVGEHKRYCHRYKDGPVFSDPQDWEMYVCRSYWKLLLHT